jgi:hypothetical protein
MKNAQNFYPSRFYAENTAKSFCFTIPEALIALHFEIHASALPQTDLEPTFTFDFANPG